MTKTRKNDIILDYIISIYYLIFFSKNNNNVKAIINLTSEVTIITLDYALKLGF